MPPPPSLQWLTTLKSKELQTLAAAVGTISSGNKPTLIASLQSHLPTGFFPSPPPTTSSSSQNENTPRAGAHEIISIDMGIRNLAYCRISLPPSWPPPSTSTARATVSALPTVTEWARISISSNPASASASSTQNPIQPGRRARKSATPPTTTTTEAEEEPTTAAAPSTPPKREPFDPQTFSHHAYALATHLLFAQPHRPQPTQILIERQRFRSMGGSSVQEWTLRVNMFEAMIYAVLQTLSEVGKWTPGGGGAGEEGRGKGVCAVEPARVGRFWVGGDGEAGGWGEEDGATGGGGEGGGRKKGLSKGTKNKVAKIRVVEGWLEEVLGGKGGGGFRLEGNARALGEAFLRKRRGERDVRVRQESFGGGEGGALVEIGKLDDVADALLQGMAWIKWEENRRRLLRDGFSAISDLG